MTPEQRKTKRILFMGTPDFAVASLCALADAGYTIAAVLTTPDKAGGRGMKSRSCAVKIAAEKMGIPIIAPENLRSEETIRAVQRVEADLGVVVAFKKLPEVIYNAPKFGTFNLHASLLPDYRGAAPIHHAIMNGETKTGVTTFLLNDRIDEGEIFLQEEVDITLDDTTGSLHDKLMDIGASLVVQTADGYLAGDIIPKPQPNTSLKKAPKIFREHCAIHWDKSALSTFNQIRGLSPYPGAYTTMSEPKHMELKILNAEFHPIPERDSSNAIVHHRKSDWIVQFPDGLLKITMVQPQGKRVMNVEDFLRGLPVGDLKFASKKP